MRKRETQIYDIQEWLPFEYILENGTIKLKNNEYIKIIKVEPINFSLKADVEKQEILKFYKTFLKSFESDIQIIIQSKKENLAKIISKIKENINSENNQISILSKQYINFLQNINSEKKSSSKNFFIIIKEEQNFQKEANNKLNEKYFKIKDALYKCGNLVLEITKKEEIKNILNSFFNSN